MTILVIGLGSMGRRRIRCLHALGVQDIVGFDTRPDRLSVEGVTCVSELPSGSFEARLICTSPESHTRYMDGLTPCFVEHGVEQVHGFGSHVYPSCTMLFSDA